MHPPGARGGAGPGSEAVAEASGNEQEEDEEEEVRVLRAGAGAAPERDEEFERELASLVLEHQGRATPAIGQPVRRLSLYSGWVYLGTPCSVM